MADALDLVRTVAPGRSVTVMATLGGSNRSVVRRVLAGGRHLIVKEYLQADEGWVRERAALSVLPSEVPAPRLLAASAIPPVVVMSDLGDGPSVADALLGTDPAAAADAVVAWARTLAGLHRATAGLRAEFAAA